MKKNSGSIVLFILIGIVLFAVAVLIAVNSELLKKTTDTSVVSNQGMAQDYGPILSENDIYRISDLFLIQENLYSYVGGDHPTRKYPDSLENLRGTSFGNIPLMDPSHKKYIYKATNDGDDYVLSVMLDKGNDLIVKGITFRQNPIPVADIKRMLDLSQLFQELKGYYSDKKEYPTELSQLVDAGWGVSTYTASGSGTPYVPTDPETHRNYGYRLFNNENDFVVSTTLSNGIEYSLRSNMGLF